MVKRELKIRIYDEKYNAWYQGLGFLVYPESPFVKQGHVIQEFTGLKDDEGKDIYEGDIVEIVWSGQKIKTQIKFHYGAFIAEYTTPEDEKSFHWLHSVQSYGCPKKIVGNIFQKQD